MQHPPASESASQHPFVLQPVFSTEDLASIASRTSKKTRQAIEAAILKSRRKEQLRSDIAAAVQLNDSLNPAPRKRRRIDRYAPPLPPAPPGSPFVNSEPAQWSPLHMCWLHSPPRCGQLPAKSKQLELGEWAALTMQRFTSRLKELSWTFLHWWRSRSGKHSSSSMTDTRPL